MIEETGTLQISLAAIATCLVAGFAIGIGYFLLLRRSTDLLVVQHRAAPALLLTLARLVLIAGALALSARQGALPLIAMALGVAAGRFAVLRREREHAG